MLEALFIFSGRLERPAFIRWSMFQVVLSIMLLGGLKGLGGETLMALSAGGSVVAELPGIVVTLFLGIALVVVPSGALLVKRMRAIGLPAWPCFAMISIVDALFVAIVPHANDSFDGLFAGQAVNTVVTIILIFAPGRIDPDSDAVETVDWVEHAAAAEAKLIEERRRGAFTAQSQRFVERPQSAPDSRDGRTFGRRVKDR